METVKSKRIPISQVKVNLDLFIHIFCFISVLLIGADRWGLNIGVNLRLDQLFLIIFVILLAIKGQYRLYFNVWIVLFACSSLISAVFAFDTTRGLIFWLSVFYNIVILIFGFASYVRTYGLKKMISVLRLSFYIQFAVLLLQLLLKVAFGYELSFLPSYGSVEDVFRFQLWFYEPSYLATYLTFWFALSVFMFLIAKDKNYLKDIVVCLAMFLISTSTTGFVGIMLVFVSAYLIWFASGRITLKKILFPLAVILLFLAFVLIFPSVYELFFARLFKMSLNESSGGRVALWAETFGVFKENVLFGVGPGNYGLYLGEDAGYVPTNVTLDILATLGISGFILFYELTLSLLVGCVKVYKKNPNADTRLLLACAYALLCFTIVLQANQGYLRLYHWMFFGIIFGGCISLKKKKGINNEKHYSQR